MASEVERYLNSKEIDEEALHLMDLELTKFKGLVSNSNLPDHIKSEVSELSIKFHIDTGDFLLTFLSFFTLGIVSGFILHYRNQKEYRAALDKFRSDVNLVYINSMK